MICEQLASTAVLFSKFHAGSGKSLLEFWPSTQTDDKIHFNFLQVLCCTFFGLLVGYFS